MSEKFFLENPSPESVPNPIGNTVNGNGVVLKEIVRFTQEHEANKASVKPEKDSGGSVYDQGIRGNAGKPIGDTVNGNGEKGKDMCLKIMLRTIPEEERKRNIRNRIEGYQDQIRDYYNNNEEEMPEDIKPYMQDIEISDINSKDFPASVSYTSMLGIKLEHIANNLPKTSKVIKTMHNGKDDSSVENTLSETAPNSELSILKANAETGKNNCSCEASQTPDGYRTKSETDSGVDMPTQETLGNQGTVAEERKTTFYEDMLKINKFSPNRSNPYWEATGGNPAPLSKYDHYNPKYEYREEAGFNMGPTQTVTREDLVRNYYRKKDSPSSQVLQNYIENNICEEGFMNASVKIEDIITYENTVKYIVKVNCRGEETEHEITGGRIRKTEWILNSIPGIVYVGNDTQFRRTFSYYINEQIRIANMSIHPHEEIREPGWHKVDGNWNYYFKNACITNADLVPSKFGQEYHKANPVDWDTVIEGFSNILADQKGIVIFLYLIQSLLWTFLNEEGFTPKYVLFLNGKTGTRKTSLALALTQIEKTDSAKYNLKATSAGLEAGLGNYRDSVMLVDDLAPTDDDASMKAMKSNVDFIIRIFGDATGKVRNLDFCETPKKQYKPHGGAIITGEFITGCESSLRRCLQLEIGTNEVRLDTLTFFQENHDAYITSLVYFLIWCRTSTPMIEQKVIEAKSYRVSSAIKISRLNEYFLQLTCCKEIFKEYLQTLNLSATALSFDNVANDAISKVIRSNEVLMTTESIENQIATALIHYIEDNELIQINSGTKISVEQVAYSNMPPQLYLTSTKLSEIFNEYRIKSGFGKSRYNAKNLVKLCVNCDLATKIKEGQTLRTSIKIPGGGNKRFVVINRPRLYTLAESE